MTILRRCNEADLPVIAKLYTDFAAEEIVYGLVAENVDAIINFYQRHGFQTWSIQMYK